MTNLFAESSLIDQQSQVKTVQTVQRVQTVQTELELLTLQNSVEVSTVFIIDQFLPLQLKPNFESFVWVEKRTLLVTKILSGIAGPHRVHNQRV